jgi:hypothetical protein
MKLKIMTTDEAKALVENLGHKITYMQFIHEDNGFNTEAFYYNTFTEDGPQRILVLTTKQAEDFMQYKGAKNGKR